MIARPDRDEPAVHRLVDEVCDLYDVAVLPARPAHPRDNPNTPKPASTIAEMRRDPEINA